MTRRSSSPTRTGRPWPAAVCLLVTAGSAWAAPDTDVDGVLTPLPGR